MKSSIFFILSLFLVTVILAPSIITLANSIENKYVVIDFNEEEKKEEKKELSEKDYFMNFSLKSSSLQMKENVTVSSFYLETAYSYSMVIFLQPPKSIV